MNKDALKGGINHLARGDVDKKALEECWRPLKILKMLWAKLFQARGALPSHEPLYKSVTSFSPGEFIQSKDNQHKERIASIGTVTSSGIPRHGISDPAVPLTREEIHGAEGNQTALVWPVPKHTVAKAQC